MSGTSRDLNRSAKFIASLREYERGDITLADFMRCCARIFNPDACAICGVDAIANCEVCNAPFCGGHYGRKQVMGMLTCSGCEETIVADLEERYGQSDGDGGWTHR